MLYKSKLAGVANTTQRWLAKSRVAVNLACRIRNQCNAVIGYAVTACPNPDANGEYWLLRSIGQRCRRFVDVGANVGNWSMACLTHAHPDARGLVFEPSQSALISLEQAFQNNPRIEIVRKAVTDHCGEAIFHEESNAGETSSLIHGVSVSGARAQTIKVTTLDEELRSRGWDQVDMLKIDTEGNDLSVLFGAQETLKNNQCGVIQFEYNDSWAPAGATLTRAISYLASFGYKTYALKPRSLLVPELTHWREYFRYSNYIALAPYNVDWLTGSTPK